MKLKLVELLTTLKTIYVSHLAASIAGTAIAGTVAVGGVGYGVYTASRPTPVEAVAVAEEVASTEAKESTPPGTKPTKNETASSEKVESAKKDSETSAPKKEEKIASKTETKTEKKDNASASESQPSAQATQTKAAESKSTTSNQSASSQNESKPSTSASNTTAPSKSDSNKQKEDAPKAHVHSWRHVDAVTSPVYESKYIVDQQAWDEVVTDSYEVPDTYTSSGVDENGYTYEAGMPTGTYHTVTETYTIHHEEQGHYDLVQTGTKIVTPAYDVCSECGAKK